MKKHGLMICLVLGVMGLLASCAKDNSNNPGYLSANISGSDWTANSIYDGSDTTGYTSVEADNDDGSLFWLSFPTGAGGSYGVSSSDNCSIEYVDPQGNSYSVQGGSLSINSLLFGGISGSFQGVALNDADCQDQLSISGSFNVNS